MRILACVVLTGLLLVGCSDSTTESVTADNNNSGPDLSETASLNAGQNDDSNENSSNDNDSGSSTDDTATGNNDSSGGGSSTATDTDEVTEPESEPGPEPEPAANVVKFTGKDFGYLRFNLSQYPADDPAYDQYTVDERVAYTVWAVNYLEAHSLLEAMHAINDYRKDHQQIKVVNGGSQSLETLIGDYCPTTGARFAAERCEFYARLAYSKTMAQDGWQVEHRQNIQVPLMCGGWGIKFLDCSYSAMGNSRLAGSGYDGPGFGEINTNAVSPIEAWQYEKNEPKITAINRAASAYLWCALDQEYLLGNYLHHQPALSAWAVRETELKVTQYGTLTVWIMSDDVVEDVYTDVTAEHDGSKLCKAAFQLDLKEVQSNVQF